MDMTSYNKNNDLKSEWEKWTNRRIQSNTVQQRVKSVLQTHELAVEQRREKFVKFLLCA